MQREDELERAWAAGFFDGEGHTAYARGFLIDVSQKAGPKDRIPETIQRFHEVVRVGKIRFYGKGNHTRMCCWRAYGEEGISALEQLWPYLGNVKRTQALEAASHIHIKFRHLLPVLEEMCYPIPERKQKHSVRTDSPDKGVAGDQVLQLPLSVGSPGYNQP